VTAPEWRGIEPRDESPHEHGGEHEWIERVGFNFFDAASGLGGIASMEYRPGERRALAELDVFLPEGPIAVAMAKANEVRRAELSVGRMRFELEEALTRWRIRSNDVALVFPRGDDRRGVASPVELDLKFEASCEPAGEGGRRTDIDKQRFMSIVSFGSLEQPGRMTGTLKVGTRELSVDATGVRERVWGVLGDEAWYAVAFGTDLAISSRRTSIGGTPLVRDVVFRDAPQPLDGLEVTRSDGRVEMVAGDGPEAPRIAGEIVATVPPASTDATVRRAMVRYRWGERSALGLMVTPQG